MKGLMICAGGGIAGSLTSLVLLATGSRPETWVIALNYLSITGFACTVLILARALRRHQ